MSAYLDLGPLTRALNKLGDASKGSVVKPFLSQAQTIIDRAISDAVKLQQGTVMKWLGRDEIPGTARRDTIRANIAGLLAEVNASPGPDAPWGEISGWSMGFVRRQITGAAVEANAIVQADATLQAAYQAMVDDIVNGIAAIPAEVIAVAGKVVEKVSVAVASAIPWWVWVIVVGTVGGVVVMVIVEK